MATEAWCDSCQTEPKAGMLCEACADIQVENARAEGERNADPQNCDRCGDRPADCCDECSSDGLCDRVLDYAKRRKALGFMTPEVFAAFELFADDLRVGDA